MQSTVRKFTPVIYTKSNHLPCSVEDFIHACELRHIDDDSIINYKSLYALLLHPTSYLKQVQRIPHINLHTVPMYVITQTLVNDAETIGYDIIYMQLFTMPKTEWTCIRVRVSLDHRLLAVNHGNEWIRATRLQFTENQQIKLYKNRCGGFSHYSWFSSCYKNVWSPNVIHKLSSSGLFSTRHVSKIPKSIKSYQPVDVINYNTYIVIINSSMIWLRYHGRWNNVLNPLDAFQLVDFMF